MSDNYEKTRSDEVEDRGRQEVTAAETEISDEKEQFRSQLWNDFSSYLGLDM